MVRARENAILQSKQLAEMRDNTGSRPAKRIRPIIDSFEAAAKEEGETCHREPVAADKQHDLETRCMIRQERGRKFWAVSMPFYFIIAVVALLLSFPLSPTKTALIM